MKHLIVIAFSVLVMNNINAQWYQVAITGGVDHTFGGAAFTSEQVGYYFENISPGPHYDYWCIYKTMDSWNTTSSIAQGGGNYDPQFMWQMYFVNDNVGFRICYTWVSRIFKTTNGGSSWSELDFSNYDVTNMFFLRGNFGYCTENPNSSAFNVYRYENDSFIQTYQSVDNYKRHVRAMYFCSDSLGFISCKNWENEYVCIRSSDSAETWTTVLSSNTINFNAIHFPSPPIGYIVADSGKIFKSVDFGINWEPLESNCHNRLNDVYFINDTAGYVAGDSGLILHTIDGGISWSEQVSNTTNTVITIRFVDDSTGFFATTNGYIFKTTNGGITNITSLSKYKIKIFPNPADNRLTIDIQPGIKNGFISIYSINGQQVLREPINNHQADIDISNIESGIYLVRISKNKEVYISKIIIY